MRLPVLKVYMVRLATILYIKLFFMITRFAVSIKCRSMYEATMRLAVVYVR